MPPLDHFANMERTAGEGESEIVVNRLSRFRGSAIGMKIFVNNQERLNLKNGKSGTIIVPDGTYTIRAASWDGASRQLTVEAMSTRIVIEAYYGGAYSATKNDLA
jgi:hypothetical protein